eukprot:32053_1
MEETVQANSPELSTNSMEHMLQCNTTCTNKCPSPDSPSFSNYSRVAMNPTPQSQTINIQFRYTDISKQMKDTSNDHKNIPINAGHDTHNCNSPTTSISLSQCRYCYQNICRNASVSQCHCNGCLCKECFKKEILLTYNRSNHEAQCTVCNNKYNVRKEFKWKCNRDCKLFYCKYMSFCGLKREQHLLDTLGGKIGFVLVIVGIAVWILSTSFVFSMPPYELPMYLYYMISIFDLIVGVATLWFIVKCRWFISFFLSILYGLRCIYLLFGWIPLIQFVNIHTNYHKSHINVMSYFISFSFIAFLTLNTCWMIDIVQQFNNYKIKQQTLVINGIRIHVGNINSNHSHN